MAARTTSQAGNWSAPSTWGGAAPPGDGDTAAVNHACTVDADAIVGTSPADQTTVVLTLANGITLAVAAGVTFRLRGNANSGGNAGGGPSLAAGSVLEFDASLASVTATTYKWDLMRGFTGPAVFTAAGTAGARTQVRSNAGGGHGYFAAGNGPVRVALAYCDFRRVGDSTNNCLTLGNAAASVDSITHCTFDADCGRVEYTSAQPAASGFDVSDTAFDQTNAKLHTTGHKNPLILKVANAASSATRKLYRCTFEQPPYLVGPGLDRQDNYFARGWDDNNGGGTIKWAGAVGDFVRLTSGGGQNHVGDLTDCVILFDAGGSPVQSGTSSGSNTTTTLNDASKSWAVNAYASSGSTAYLVEITGGAGVGQRRLITGNTATQVTVAYRWDVTPDATSAYAVVADIGNPHGLIPSTGLTSGTLTLDGVAWQSAGCDTQGDCWLHLDADGVTHTQVRNLILPNAMGDSGGTPFTLFDRDAGTFYFLHNTFFTGAQSCSLREPSTSGTGAGQCDGFRSNVGWCDPARAVTPPNNTDRTKYWGNGGSYGPYMAVDTSSPTNPAAGTADLIVAGTITNNCAYGVLAGVAKGFQLNMSVTPDATNLFGVDPSFADRTRTFWSWAVSRGSFAATVTGQVADGLAYVKADPTLTRTSLLPYLRAGFAPRAGALKNAGHDGVTIGAVEGVFGGVGLVGAGLVGPGALVSPGGLVA